MKLPTQCDTGISVRPGKKMLQPCFCFEVSCLQGVLCSLSLYLISPHLHRCLRMTGAASLRWGKMTRYHAGGCAVAATSRPWQKRTAETRTAAQNPHPKSRQDELATWRPHSHLSPRWPRSSKYVLGPRQLLIIFSVKCFLDYFITQFPGVQVN